MKIKNVIVILVILIIILLAVLFGKGNSSKSIKITPETKKEIITLVNNYYNNMISSLFITGILSLLAKALLKVVFPVADAPVIMIIKLFPTKSPPILANNINFQLMTFQEAINYCSYLKIYHPSIPYSPCTPYFSSSIKFKVI